jgi:cytochrome c oxidase cbb3-type subunit III
MINYLIHKMKKIALTVGLLIPGTTIMAQEPSNTVPIEFFDSINILVGFTIVILIITIGVMSKVIKSLVNAEVPSRQKHEDTPAVETPQKKKISWWQRVDRQLTDAVPLEKEADIMLDHEYDGIRELDNSLPPWWKYGFYITIVVAIIYMLNYHVLGTGKLQLEEYNDELVEAEIMKQERLKTVAALVDENTVTLMEAEEDIEAGNKIFQEKCAVCHGKFGEGGVGPNMTDDFWIHGGSIQDIFKIIKYGAPQKGMISWQSQIKPVEIQQLSSFIKTLHGTNPENQKEPQGEKYVEDASALSDSTSTITDTTGIGTH